MRSLLAILIVLAACGDDGNVNPLDDAPLAPDAPPVDGPTSGLVTLTITQAGNPQANVRVYFQNPDSSLVSSTTTDATGVASAIMGIGGFVTAVDPFVALGGGPINIGDVRTFAGVKPLDNLVLTDAVRGGAITNVNVIAPEDPGAGEYAMLTNCGAYILQPSGGSGAPAGGPISLSGCGATIDLVIETRDSGGTRSSFSVNNQAVTEGGDIDVQLGTYLTALDTTWMYVNVPANLDSVTASGVLATSRGPIVFFNETQQGVDAGSATTAAVRHAAADDSIQINLSTFTGPGTPFSEHRFLEWGAPTAAYVLAMDAATLTPDVTSEPAVNVGNRSVTWTTGGTNTHPADFALARASFDRNVVGAEGWSWEIVAPHDTNAIAFPRLPAPDEDLNPVVGDVGTVEELLIVQVPGGYDTVRAKALSLFDDPTGVVLGATGQAVIQVSGRGVIVLPAKRTPTNRFNRLRAKNNMRAR